MYGKSSLLWLLIDYTIFLSNFPVFPCETVGRRRCCITAFFLCSLSIKYWPLKKKSLVRTELLISNQQTVLAWYSVNLLEMNQISSSEILFSCDWWNSLLFFFKSSPFDNVFFDKEPNRHMEFQNKKDNNSNLLEVSL